MLVPVGLGKDGGCGYIGELAVSFYYALIFIVVKRLETVSIYKQEVRFYAQPADCALHASDGCVENIDAVYFLRTDFFYCPGDGLTFYDWSQGFPCLFAHLF